MHPEQNKQWRSGVEALEKNGNMFIKKKTWLYHLPLDGKKLPNTCRPTWSPDGHLWDLLRVCPFLRLYIQTQMWNYVCTYIMFVPFDISNCLLKFFLNWTQRKIRNRVRERESMKKQRQRKEKRGRIALTRQHPLLFPRSSASCLPLKQNYKGKEGRKEGKRKEDLENGEGRW